MSAIQAIQQCDEIVELIDEELPQKAWDTAPELFEDIREKVASVQETIQNSGEVTERQQNALDNWEDCVRKWIR